VLIAIIGRLGFVYDGQRLYVAIRGDVRGGRAWYGVGA